MKKTSLGVNAALSAIKTICAALFPLITFPYASRVLHVTNIGIYNFCASVISYFTMLAGLGVNTYAIREGARYRDNKAKMSDFASDVFSINMVSTILSYIALGICVLALPGLYDKVQVIGVLSIPILFTTVGCEWLFYIYENFGYITFRSIAFQIVSVILMFAWVKDESDLMQYAAVTVVASAGANVINAISKRKYCRVRFVLKKSMAKHLMPILVLFVNSIAMTIYINSDVTMLSVFAGDYETGLYSVSTKVYTMVKTLLGALIVVSIPRLSACLGKGEVQKFSEMANKIWNALIVILIPAITGLFLLSRNVILILSGDEYVQATLSLQILSIALLFSIFSWFYTSCILIPNKQENCVLLATVIAAVGNVVLNVFLIPVWQQNAAALTTGLSELTSALICFWFGRKYFRSNVRIKDAGSVLAGCIGIAGVCIFVLHSVDSLIGSTILAVVLSVLVYGAILVILKNSFIKIGIDLITEKIRK